jgi:dihydrolipoamide dehydrogenase
MATVGKLYSELDAEQVVIGKGVIAKGPRHEILNLHSGLMHIYADKKSGVILGAEILGHGAEHFAHYLALAITHKLSVKQVLEAPFYHPCLEEVMKMALNSALFQL